MAWPLSDNFNGVAGDTIQTWNSAWVQHQYNNSASQITDAGRVRTATTANSMYYYNDAPTSADYSVEADVYAASQPGSSYIGSVCARIVSNANTFYMLRYQATVGWHLYKLVNGTASQLGSTVTTKNITTGASKHCKLEVNGSTVNAYIDGATTPDISVTDTSITSAGYAGIRLLTSTTIGDTVGIHLDNFSAAYLSGGTSYTETLTALAENYAAVTDIATYIDAAEAIITAGATADATVQMLEGVLSAAVVAASVTDTAVVVDTVQTGATAEVTVHDTAQMVENAATAVAAEASVTDAIVSGVAENLLASATSLASATDVQLMVDNLTIMVVSGASIGEIYTYLEQLTAAATSGASVTDVLVTQFVGRYLFVVTVPPREFTATVSPRSYLTTVGPR